MEQKAFTFSYRMEDDNYDRWTVVVDYGKLQAFDKITAYAKSLSRGAIERINLQTINDVIF